MSAVRLNDVCTVTSKGFAKKCAGVSDEGFTSCHIVRPCFRCSRCTRCAQHVCSVHSPQGAGLHRLAAWASVKSGFQAWIRVRKAPRTSSQQVNNVLLSPSCMLPINDLPQRPEIISKALLNFYNQLWRRVWDTQTEAGVCVYLKPETLQLRVWFHSFSF